jgi:hypothetical protein
MTGPAERLAGSRSAFAASSPMAATADAGSLAWVALAGILVLAACLRLVFFNGVFGSDDIVYLNRAMQISQGIWTAEPYNGSLRYAFNIPAGVALAIFGVGPVTANLWPIACSLLEIAAVFVFCLRFWNLRTAVYAGLILATTSLHIAVATRIHTDPIVSCFLTGGFVLFFLAERGRSRVLYYLAGLSMGGVFWTKELATVTLFTFVAYPFVVRRIDWRWSIVVAGGVTMLAGHLLLMQAIAGDPLYAIRTVTGQVSRNFVHGSDGESQWWFYLKYMFLDIRHTGLVALLATAAVVVGWRARTVPRHVDPGFGLTVFWFLGLLAVLSLFPVSLNPFRIVFKQSNYLTLFLAPMAVLAAWLLARTGGWQGRIGLIVTLVLGILLGALQQQSYRLFVSNGVALADYMTRHPDETVLGSTNNGNIVRLVRMMDRDPDPARHFVYLPKPGGAPAAEDAPKLAAAGSRALLVLDRETIGWGREGFEMDVAPACWKRVDRLEPRGFGVGAHLVDALVAMSRTLPGAVAGAVVPRLERLAKPKAADVYQVDPADLWCRDRPTT